MNLRELQAQYIAKERQVTKAKLVVGALVRTTLSTDDGLNLTDGRKEKPKKLIVIGFDKNKDTIYGSVLVNSELNPKAAYSDEYLSAQFLLSHETYPDFLRYDSYADCGVIFAIPVEKLLSGEYFGSLTEDDLGMIFDILETTETLTTKEKKRFGIKRRNKSYES